MVARNTRREKGEYVFAVHIRGGLRGRPRRDQEPKGIFNSRSAGERTGVAPGRWGGMC